MNSGEVVTSFIIYAFFGFVVGQLIMQSGAMVL